MCLPYPRFFTSCNFSRLKCIFISINFHAMFTSLTFFGHNGMLNLYCNQNKPN